jgi:hypothetical protein
MDPTIRWILCSYMNIVTDCGSANGLATALNGQPQSDQTDNPITKMG